MQSLYVKLRMVKLAQIFFTNEINSIVFHFFRPFNYLIPNSKNYALCDSKQSQLDKIKLLLSSHEQYGKQAIDYVVKSDSPIGDYSTDNSSNMDIPKRPHCDLKNGVFLRKSLSEDEYSEERKIDPYKKLESLNLLKLISFNVHESPDTPNSSRNSSVKKLMEKTIINDGLQKFESNSCSHLGPFNFRMLLRSTDHAPTESLRKRKIIFTSRFPADKNLKF